MTVVRKLYPGAHSDARYEIGPGEANEAYLRVWDVLDGDALVFLTPARARRLIADLEPYATKRRRR